MVGRAAACILVGRPEYFPPDRQGHVWWWALECLGIDCNFRQPFGCYLGLCSYLACCLVWCPMLGSADSWVELGLGFSWRPLLEVSSINILSDQEFSGGPVSWTQCSHHRGSGLTSGWGTKTSQAVRPGNKWYYTHTHTHRNKTNII